MNFLTLKVAKKKRRTYLHKNYFIYIGTFTGLSMLVHIITTHLKLEIHDGLKLTKKTRTFPRVED